MLQTILLLDAVVKSRISGRFGTRKKMAYIKNENAISSEDIGSSQYQVFVNDLVWADHPIQNYQVKRSYQSYGELPRQIVFDIPANVIEQANKNSKTFDDVIESFICNALSRKFMHEVYGCQIWLLF